MNGKPLERELVILEYHVCTLVEDVVEAELEGARNKIDERRRVLFDEFVEDFHLLENELFGEFGASWFGGRGEFDLKATLERFFEAHEN